MSGGVLIKCLKDDGRSVHNFIDAQGSRSWDLPRGGKPGAWKGPVAGALKPHQNGLHLAKKDCLIDWLTGNHYIAETDGETAEGLDCVVARRARLVEHLPVHEEKLRAFSENWLSMAPRVIRALGAYTEEFARAAEDCADAVRNAGLQNAHAALGILPAFKYVRQQAMAQSYDLTHSIEYQHCTKASKACLDSLTAVFNMSGNGSRAVEHATVVSNKIALALDALHQNYHFMQDLCAQGYDHEAEASAMEKFLGETGLKPASPGSAREVTGFFANVRKWQNRDILPALGL